jgi:hypothetical protein
MFAAVINIDTLLLICLEAWTNEMLKV